MSWGGEPVRRDQQGKSIIRMQGVYATADEIASGKKFGRLTADWHSSGCAGAVWLARHDPRLFEAKNLRKFYSRCAV
jgi:hypothetical protein